MRTPAGSDLFFSKKDPLDQRLGELVQKEPHEAKWLLVGYPDDEGIKNNKGRVGASEAPNKIREYFYKMTPSAFSKQKFSLADVGNFSGPQPLSEKHEEIKEFVSTQLKNQKKLITLGGGHDYGYADGAGFLMAFAKAKPLVINFDAHMDVRPLPKDGTINSGTPFFRLLSEFKNFEFFEVGLQPHCNSPHHMKWLLEKKAKIISILEIEKTGLLPALKKKLRPNKKRPLFISLDIDALSSSVAPGCSQSWASGISLHELLECLKWLQKNFDLKLFSIYEVSPPLDVDNITVKTAATLIHRILFPENL